MGKPKLEELVPGDGIDVLVDSQLELLEAEMARQDEAMKTRASAASTRSAVLIGASAVLSGVEFATSSWSALITGAALALYLAAAVLGLVSVRSKVGREPLLPAIVREYAEYATVSMRRELLLARLRAHAHSVDNLAERHRLLVWGFWALAVAWVLAAAGTVLGIVEVSPPSVTEIRIVE